MEVIPNEVAVISLNTMYFYDSNKGPYCVMAHFTSAFKRLTVGMVMATSR